MNAILETYQRLHRRSAQMHREAVDLFPDGVTHDTRRLQPFPIYVERAQGPCKWDIDGHQIVDYLVGHGALLLGHSHPDIVAAVKEQVEKGTHYGASHELEVRWAGLIKKLAPSAELIRFTSSGTEATHMAIRLARAFSGRDKILRFRDHFHGWHDNVVGMPAGESTQPRWPGVPEATMSNQIVIPPNDIAILEETLRASSDIAAAIVEPTGASWGTFPLAPGFLTQLREATQRHGVLLIMDEVITGFRVAPGGAQEYYNIRPDITTLAKILAGGLPGGAVAGRREIIEMISTRDDEWNDRRRVAHQGTFNANPLSASSGVTALSLIADGEAQRYVNGLAKRLVQGMNQAIRRRNVAGCAYGSFSMFHITLGQNCPEPLDGMYWPLDDKLRAMPPRMRPDLATVFKAGMLNHGADLMSTGGMLSIAHTQQEVEATVDALDATLAEMQKEDLI